MGINERTRRPRWRQQAFLRALQYQFLWLLAVAVAVAGSAIYAKNGFVDRIGEETTSGVSVGAGLGSRSAGETSSRGPAEYVDVGDAVPFICAA